MKGNYLQGALSQQHPHFLARGGKTYQRARMREQGPIPECRIRAQTRYDSSFQVVISLLNDLWEKETTLKNFNTRVSYLCQIIYFILSFLMRDIILLIMSNDFLW